MSYGSRILGFEALAAILGSAMSGTGPEAALRAMRSGEGVRPIRVMPRNVGRSHYMPHQGKRECARRRRQMEVAA